MTDRATIAMVTSTAIGSIAVARGDDLVHFETFDEGMVHGREIVKRLHLAFKNLSLEPSRIALVVADVGPGSFTGVRVGVTTAKTIAFASGAPIVEILAVEATARNLPPEKGDRWVLVDAKRGQVYAAFFAREEKDLVLAKPTEIHEVEKLVDVIPGGSLLLGDALSEIGERLGGQGYRIASPSAWSPRADHLLRLGRKAHAAGGAVPPEAVVPRYLRPSTPEIRRSDRSG